MSDLPRRGFLRCECRRSTSHRPDGPDCAAAMARTGVDGVQEPTRTETDDALQMPPHRPHRSIRWIAGDGDSRSLDQAAERRVRESPRRREAVDAGGNVARKSKDAPVPGLPIRSLDKSARNPIFARLDRAIGLRQSVAPAGHDHYAARRGGARDVPQTVSGGRRRSCGSGFGSDSLVGRSSTTSVVVAPERTRSRLSCKSRIT